MPILDPSQQLYFLEELNNTKTDYSNHFFIRYLKVASRNLNRNSQTIEASILFKNDLKVSIDMLKKLFGCTFTRKSDFDDPTIRDLYRFLYDNINPQYKEKILKEQKGNYRLFYDTLPMQFFQPFTLFPEGHSWFFTTTPIAILKISEKQFLGKNSEIKDFIRYINLEIDLMIASGFTIVLCVNINFKNVQFYQSVLNDTIKPHPFAEIHFNIEENEDKNNSNKKSNIDDLFTILTKIFDQINGHFYLYMQFLEEKSANFKNFFKSLKIRPRFHHFFFSRPPSKALKKIETATINQFVYSKTGFDDNLICVRLCNIPLYKTDNNEVEIVPNEVSGISLCYVNSKSFVDFSLSRVQIIFDDSSNRHHHVYRYIEFDDLHNFKIDLYVKRTIYLVNTNSKILKLVSKMKSDISHKVKSKEKFKKENIFAFFKYNQMKKGLTYVSYAYEKNARKNNHTFSLHDNQIFTAFDACQTCIFDTENMNKKVVYQVETGEGKSCIIQIIAAVLALMKKTVHIASSNINLSNRDYYNSFKFFKMLGLSSAVLLHYNELPYVTFDNSSNDDIAYDEEYFPDKFFKSELFNNSSNMNFSVCGITADSEVAREKANIIFSTFVNFECLYLKMMEMNTTFIVKYFNECSLIIDEADSILIDELTNGTILSRSVKSNENDILEFVYKSRMDKIDINSVFNNVKSKWPECVDLKINDIQSMFDEIDLVNQDEFVDGKKYSIETINKKKASLAEMIKDAQENIENIKLKCQKEAKKIASKMAKKCRKSSIKHKKKENKNKIEYEEKYEYDKTNEENTDNNNNNTDNNNYNTDNDNTNNNNNTDNYNNDNTDIIKKVKSKKSKTVKYIIPFDYDHKGILEPNKEFGGFVQQFIAIKERLNNPENDNIIIKDMSMNYLYVSHPIFVNLYNSVIGLTGTIGRKYEKSILSDQYNIITQKIPRHNANLLVEYPIILCDKIKERNKKIVTEVVHFNHKGNPVLVIFQDLNEISEVLFMLIEEGIKNINIFDGKDERVKPDIVAGMKSAVSLGTNVCGRGTDIQKPVKPLHVIVTYFSSNSRVMDQAFGRTARQGQKGSVRIICIKDQFLTPIDQFKQNDMDSIIKEFKSKNDLQLEFIQEFKNNREWIFNTGIKNQKLTDDVIKDLRKSRITINRNGICNYKFPICMSIPTFLSIQAQKIFSLYNCPNCKYTWMLFQRYIREMILETWSLFIDKSDKNYRKKKRNISYHQYLIKKKEKIVKLIKDYLPDYEDKKNYEILPSFMFIFNKVVNRYEDIVMSSFPEKLSKVYKQSERKFCNFSIGFRPFTLANKSGSRINTVDGTNQDQNYIGDPELKYFQKVQTGHSIALSITQKIDGVFNFICKKINDVIGSYIGLKFFLRRTLAGCEFGICVDFELENENKKDFNCLIDKDPLVLFTIQVRSLAPILAGILIIGLVYIASISDSIANWISNFPVQITTKLVKKVLTEVVSLLMDKSIEKLCKAICSFLTKIIVKQIMKLEEFNKDMAQIFKVLLKIVAPKNFEGYKDKINELFEGHCKIKMKSNFSKKFIKGSLPFTHFVKIGFLLMLCFASFMLNFFFHKQAVKYNASNVAEKYNKDQNANESLEENKEMVDDKDFGEIIKLDEKDIVDSQ